MASGDASLANTRKTQQALDWIEEVEGVVSTPSNPFWEAATAEAAGDALIGIDRSSEWVKKRTRELFKEAKSRAVEEELPEYIRREDLSEIILKLNRDEYETYEAQKVFNDLISNHYAKAEAATKVTISRETVIQEEVAKRVEEIEKVLAEKSWQDRMKSNKATLTFLSSAMLCIMIPIFSMLPGNWKFCQMLPLIAIAYINWKPMRELGKMMKDLKNERVSPS